VKGTRGSNGRKERCRRGVKTGGGREMQCTENKRGSRNSGEGIRKVKGMDDGGESIFSWHYFFFFFSFFFVFFLFFLGGVCGI